MLAQLLASEGFDSVEEIAYVEEKELSSIDGLDQDTASEIQGRAREYLAKIAAEQDLKRRELGVEDGVAEIERMTPAMLVALGEAGILNVEDLAGCATDELAGWSERKDGETIQYPGILEGFDVSREDAEAIIMQARVKVGWITEADLQPATEEASAVQEPAQA
jgi:transcription termination/antitermination protein NusA